MNFSRASLGLKLNLALVFFFLMLGGLAAVLILYGFNRTQDNATGRSQEALEELGEVALLGIVSRQADYGALALEAAAEMGFRGATFLDTFQASGAQASVDTSRLVRTEEGVLYDPADDRITDVLAPNYVELTDAVLDEIAYSAPLDSIVPALMESFPDSIREENFDPTVFVFIGANSTVRYFPPFGLHTTVPPDLDLTVLAKRLGPEGNPDRAISWRAPYEDAAGKGLVMTVEVPIYDGDTYKGVFQIDLSLAQLVEQVDLLKLTEKGFAFYVGNDGEVLQGASRDLIAAEVEGGNAALVSTLDRMRAGDSDVSHVVIGGEEMFIGYAPMANVGGSLAIAASVEELTAPAAAITAGIEAQGQRTLRVTLLAMGALFTLGLVGASYLNRRVLIRPIEALASGTRAVAAGDLDVTIPTRGDDELATLGASFNHMTADLRERRDALRQEIVDRRAAQQELAALFAAMTDAVMVIDGEGLYLRVPATNAPTTLIPPQGLPGKYLRDVMPLEQAGLFLGSIRQALAEQQTTTIEYPLLIDKVKYWFSAAVSPVSEHEVVVVTRDITERVNARQELERQVEERTRELTALLGISSNLTSTLELRPLLGLIIDQLREIADFHRCSIFQLEGDTMATLDSRATFSDTPLLLSIPTAAIGPIWERMRRGQSVLIDDVHSDSELARAYRSGAGELINTEPFQAIHSCLGVPLTSKDGIIGMLILTHMQRAYYTDRQAGLMQAIATQIAVALENARLYERAQQLATIEERQRLARELHDSVSQALYGIALGAKTARTLLDSDPARAVEPVDYVLQLADAGLAEMRALIFELRPESLETEGLVAALEKQVAATRARYGLEVVARLADEPSMSLAEKEVFYRVGQEALHNIVKHSRATKVDITLSNGAGVILEVRDNGVGFDTNQSFPGHMGLVSITERAASIGAKVAVESTSGAGSVVRLSLGA